MANLFSKNTLTLQISDKEAFDKLENWFYQAYSSESFNQYCAGLLSILPKDLIITVEGKAAATSDYISGQPFYKLRKMDKTRVCALVHCCPENLRTVLGMMPEYVRKALTFMAKNGCASCRTLAEIGAGEFFKKQKSRGYYYYDSSYVADKWAGIFPFKSGPLQGFNTYERDGYIYIPSKLLAVYCEALVPGMTDTNRLYADSPEEGCIVVKGEQNYLTAYPVIVGMHRQGLIKTNKMKIGYAAAKKVISKTCIPDLIPDTVHASLNVSGGQYFLSYIEEALSTMKDSAGPDAVAAKAVEKLMRAPLVEMYPALLPHTKGFRAAAIKYVHTQRWPELIIAALGSYPDKWLSLDQLCDFSHSGEFDEWDVGHRIRVDSLSSMEFYNTLDGKRITPDNQGEEVDRELLKACAYALNCLGTVDLAYLPGSGNFDSPCQEILYIKMTALGRFVFGLDKTYNHQEIDSSANFILDTERLIITFAIEDNPYAGLLSEISTQIGANRFIIDSGSFLRNCKDINDVESKIKFFNDFICPNPPSIWQDFFQTLKQRCKPLKNSNGTYILQEFDPENKDLARLLASDPDIRKLIILAEGYRILIRESDFNKFATLMKDRGYLV